jgi:APA family basic amino acid/polyamine antiporter
LTFGILTVIAVYVLVTLAYMLALGFEGMAGSGLDDTEASLVASRAAQALLGDTGERFVAVMIMVSILGPLNGLTLSGPRVYYAMARDRLFPAVLARVHAVHRTPHLAIILQGAFAALLALLFTFEILTSFVVLAAWSQYALTGIGLLWLRRRRPDIERPYKVPLYPWLPVLFVLLSSGFVLYLIASATLGALAASSDDRDMLTFVLLVVNLGIMALSWPAYAWFRRRNERADVVS